MSDRNFASYTGEGVIEDRIFIPPSDSGSGRWDDVLKFSRAKYRIRGTVKAYGGLENACDINNNSEVIVEDGATLILIGGDQAGLVVKGNSILRTEGSGRVVFIPNDQSRCDILKDDWSDQSQHSSTIEGNFERADGKALRMVWGRGSRPKILGGRAKAIWWWVIGAHVWNFLRGLVPCVLAAAALSGCAMVPRAQQGGHAVTAPGITVAAPENPATPTTQTHKRMVTRRFTPESLRPPTIKESLPVAQEPTAGHAVQHVAEEFESEETTTTIGAAQKDTTREISAKLAALRPVQMFGGALVAAAVAMFWPPVRLAIGAGKEIQMWTALAGAALIFIPPLLPGNERLILVTALVGLALFWLSHRLSYKSGMLDANHNGIPDNEEK
ncbi:hypothetical protein [Nibricoccus sp. IMCC34717]|uniref:hypothetical protein n=1 Tax=Nibricoccus sp. IMCC34717 TaxID=3034021 RepID=UPI00384F8545